VTPDFKAYSGSLKAVVIGVPALGVLFAVIAGVTGGFLTSFEWRWAIIPGLSLIHI